MKDLLAKLDELHAKCVRGHDWTWDDFGHAAARDWPAVRAYIARLEKQNACNHDQHATFDMQPAYCSGCGKVLP